MKLLGTTFLSIVPLLFFYFQGEDVKKRALLRASLLDLILHMEFQIRHFSREQEQIFSDFEGKPLEQIGFLPDLREESKREPCGAFDRTLRSYLPSFSFDPTCEKTLLALSEHFGMQGKESQLAEISQTHRILSETAEKEKVNVENRIKILRMIGLTAGIGIWILMI